MIKIATQKEALSLFNRDEIIARVGAAESFIFQPFIAQQQDAQMLFVFWPQDDETIEVHIAMPKEYISASRALCGQIIDWLFKHGAKRIVTNAPPGKIANLARKVGMKPYNVGPDKIYFEVRKWE